MVYNKVGWLKKSSVGRSYIVVLQLVPNPPILHWYLPMYRHNIALISTCSVITQVENYNVLSGYRREMPAKVKTKAVESKIEAVEAQIIAVQTKIEEVEAQTIAVQTKIEAVEAQEDDERYVWYV